MRPGDFEALAVSKQQVAAMLSVSVRTVERLLAAGELAAVAVAGCSRVLAKSVHEYVQRQTGKVHG